METTTAPAAPGTSDVCPQCGNPANWQASSWCGECGYYPAIGRLIDPLPEVAEEQVYDSVWDAIPAWLWILAGGVLGLAVTSIFVRVAFAPGPVRFWWTVVQMACGMTALLVAHFLAYLYGASRSDKIGPFDAVMKPIATWQPIFRSLPKKANLLWLATWGIWAVVFAYFVIDGIDYQALAEARQKAAAEAEQERKSPMGAIIGTAQTVAQMQGQLPAGNQADNLEDALGDFTGGVVEQEFMEGDGTGLEGAITDFQEQSGIDPYNLGDPSDGEPGANDSRSDSESGEDGESLDDGPVTGTTKPRNGGRTGHTAATGDNSSGRAGEFIQCMVIGYTTNAEGDPRSLLLAAPDRRGLHFVAKVPMEQVDPAAQRGLKERFLSLHQRMPVVKSPYGGRWLKPQLFCEVRFQGWTAAGRLYEPYITQFAMMDRPSTDLQKSTSATR